MKKFKPSFPSIHLLIAVSVMVFSAIFLISPFQDLKMLVAAILFASASVTILWFIDYFFLTIEQYQDALKFKGYFSIRKFQLKIKDIEGFQVHQKVDQMHGLHEEIQIVIKNKSNLILSKIAYNDYEDVKAFFQSRFKFLGHKELKYGKLLGKLIPIMFLISGIFAALVGLLKILK